MKDMERNVQYSAFKEVRKAVQNHRDRDVNVNERAFATRTPLSAYRSGGCVNLGNFKPRVWFGSETEVPYCMAVVYPRHDATVGQYWRWSHEPQTGGLALRQNGSAFLGGYCMSNEC